MNQDFYIIITLDNELICNLQKYGLWKDSDVTLAEEDCFQLQTPPNNSTSSVSLYLLVTLFSFVSLSGSTIQWSYKFFSVLLTCVLNVYLSKLYHMLYLCARTTISEVKFNLRRKFILLSNKLLILLIYGRNIVVINNNKNHFTNNENLIKNTFK